MRKHSTITRLLKEYSLGDASALERLVPIVYRQLRNMAKAHFGKERSGHTLQPTAIVHEIFLKLIEAKSIQMENRLHFFALASQMMRRILINHAQSKNRLKRGGGAVHVSFDEALHEGRMGSEELIQLDEALQRFALRHERQAKMVELRYFGGLSVEETAQVLDCSPATVKRDWLFSRAWLHREIKKAK